MKIRVTDTCSVFFWIRDGRIETAGFQEKRAVAFPGGACPAGVRSIWVGGTVDPPALTALPLLQLNYQQKVGIMYCRAGQSTEEEMYNNESAGPAFEEFLQLLGERVRLKGFEKYRAQLDTKSKNYLYSPATLISLLLC